MTEILLRLFLHSYHSMEMITEEMIALLFADED
ncbi:hypothetical protein PMIT1320_01167 [Prochlorococcus marinus str. MIT 1320]|nr:hypothetical protein PMIT1320_01167 [Prochlorococcus marinus str. MIT 1320]